MRLRTIAQNEKFLTSLIPMTSRPLDRDRQLVAERLRSVGARRTYATESFIFHEGAEPTHVFAIESGLARIEHSTRSGRIVLFDLATVGRVFGEIAAIDHQPRSATVVTITETTVHIVSAADFRQMLAADSELQAAVLRTVTHRFREQSSQFVETSIMDAPSRVAARLARLVEIEQSLGRSTANADGSIELKLPISQQELGQWSGLSREGTGKGLSALRTRGIIETGRKRVKINNLDQLIALAQND